MKKTYIQPLMAIEPMDVVEMLAASGVNLNSDGLIESVSGGADLTDGVIMSRELDDLEDLVLGM